MKLLKYFIYTFFIPFWWLQKIFPRDKKKWVFGSWSGHKYSDNSKVFFEYILLFKKEEIDVIWITKSKTIYNKLLLQDIPCEYAYSLKGIISCLKAGVIVIGSGKRDVNKFFINGAKIVNTWHGAPMKKIGLDYINFSKLKLFVLKNLYPFLWDFKIDYFVSTHEVFSKKLSSAFNLSSDKILVTGYPRNDLLISNNENDYINKLKLKFNYPNILFYLPTFRDSSLNKDLLFNYNFDLESWSDYLIRSNSLLLIKGHNVADLSSYNNLNERIIFVKNKNIPEINSVFDSIDILITDYSGVYFDFLLTDKKIILAPVDLNEYLKYDRELYFDYYNDFHELKCISWSSILLEIKKGKEIFYDKKTPKENFNKYLHGNNSKRLYEKLINII